MIASANSDALTEFLSCIEVFGAVRTSQMLSNYRKKYSLQENPDAQFVLDMVSRTFQIPIKEITHGVIRKNERRDAIGFCVYLLYDVLDYTMEDVGIMLQQSVWVCYKHKKIVTRLNPNKEEDKRYLGWKKRFERKVASLKPRQDNGNHDDNQHAA